MADPITPGVPRRFAPITEIQRTPRTEPPSKPPPRATASEPNIVVKGHGWGLTVPVALLVAVASLFAGRSTAPSPDVQQLTAIQAETRADVAEIKRDIAAIRENIATRDNAASNRLVVIEARLAAMQARP